jgi:hypothetical protein
MVAEYVGNSTNIHYKEFEIIKINRTKAECKCSNWEIVDYSNLQFKTNRKTVELSHSIINKTEKQPNNKKQW